MILLRLFQINFIESRASILTTSIASDPGDLTERDSLSQANIELQAEKILKVGLRKTRGNFSVSCIHSLMSVIRYSNFNFTFKFPFIFVFLHTV